jgi:hypothetical protein
MIQYAVAFVIAREFSAHWMPACAGMTTEDWPNYPYPCAAAGCLASIWPIASTTASNVSMVEAWRAL